MKSGSCKGRLKFKNGGSPNVHLPATSKTQLRKCNRCSHVIDLSVAIRMLRSRGLSNASRVVAGNVFQNLNNRIGLIIEGGGWWGGNFHHRAPV